MKAKKQEINKAQIQEVEHLFFSTINNNELLFIKAKDENKPRAYVLSSGTFERFITEFKSKVSIKV